VTITLLGNAQLASGNASPGLDSYMISPASTAGSTLVLTGSTYYNMGAVTGPLAITDNSGTNVWQYSTADTMNPPTVIAGPLDMTMYYSCWVAWVINAASVTTINVNFSNSYTTSVSVTYSQWSGIVQGDNGSMITGTSSGTDASCAPVTLRNAGDMVTGVGYGITGNMGGEPPMGTSSYSSSMTGEQWYAFPGMTGSYTATYDNWASNSDYAAVIMSFSPVFLGPVATPPLYQMRSTRQPWRIR